ncbi:MAG: metal ABC transporter permease, partial [Acidobacteriota bacterium]|nr:metal ABC transporter permease [Acidobacteriota bacterium]
VARARGVPAPLVSAAFLVLLGVATAEVSQITGSLLVFALLVMPAATARQITPRPGLGLALSVAVALLVVWVGLGLAFYSVYPVGFYVTTTGLVCYLGSAAARRAATRRRGGRSAPSGRVS